MMCGHFDEGRRRIAMAGRIETNREYKLGMFGVDLSQSIDEFQYLKSLGRYKSPERPVSPLIVCADRLYLETYLPAFLSSLGGFSPAENLWAFEIVNSTSDSKIASDEFVRVEIPDGWMLSDSSRRVAFSCARWLLVPSVLEFLPEGEIVFVLDVDLVLNRSLSQLRAQMMSCDVGLVFYPAQILNPLALVSGSLVGIKNGKESRRFARSVADIIYNAFTEGQNEWHLDQVALLLSSLATLDLKLTSLPSTSIQSLPFPDDPYLNSSSAFFVSQTPSAMLFRRSS